MTSSGTYFTTTHVHARFALQNMHAHFASKTCLRNETSNHKKNGDVVQELLHSRV